MGKFRRLDRGSGRQNRENRSLRRQIQEGNAAKRLASSSTPSSGNTLINGLLSILGSLSLTGTMSMKSAAGSELVRMGDMPIGDRGIQFFRETGTTAFDLRKRTALDDQSWTFYDALGNELVAEQQFLGGLFKPFLSMPFQPVAATSGTPVTCGPYGLERSMSSSTWTTLFLHDGKRQNPYIDIKVYAVCSDGTTAGEVRIIDQDAGTPLPDFFGTNWLGSIPAGTTSVTAIDPGPTQTGIYQFGVGLPMRLGVQVRRTAGSGTITLSVTQAIGG